MTDFSPFKVLFVDGAANGSPEQMYQVVADFEDQLFSAHKKLFDEYGILDGRLSLVDVTALIVEGSDPELLGHFDFDEESYQLDMYADSEEALIRFANIVCPVYRDLEELERYVRRIAAK
ncbi:hypothetical protein [Hymenobacter psychrophilus]|uniref:hypothetical protein n=1 Tax=Hymenobacter psychrophilus TaxID=651662 RepID=UPI000B808AAC|nr:hypothetical protein [Hymenobacter psychrophilus]